MYAYLFGLWTTVHKILGSNPLTTKSSGRLNSSPYILKLLRWLRIITAGIQHECAVGHKSHKFEMADGCHFEFCKTADVSGSYEFLCTEIGSRMHHVTWFGCRLHRDTFEPNLTTRPLQLQRGGGRPSHWLSEPKIRWLRVYPTRYSRVG